MPGPSWYPEASFRHVFVSVSLCSGHGHGPGQARKFGAKIVPRSTTALTLREPPTKAHQRSASRLLRQMTHGMGQNVMSSGQVRNQVLLSFETSSSWPVLVITKAYELLEAVRQLLQASLVRGNSHTRTIPDLKMSPIAGRMRRFASNSARNFGSFCSKIGCQRIGRWKRKCFGLEPS